jgi:hypothetical protein
MSCRSRRPARSCSSRTSSSGRGSAGRSSRRATTSSSRSHRGSTSSGRGSALYAHFITYIDPGVFGFSISETLLIMVILGGSGTLWGPVGGAVVFAALPELLRIAPETRSLVYGIILLLIVLYRPAGMATWLGRRRAVGAAPPA